MPKKESFQSQETEPQQRIRVGRVTLFKIAGSPNWYMDYSLDGKQYRLTTKTRSLKQARILAEQKSSELVLGQAQTPQKSRLRIFDIAEEYIESLVRQEKSKVTQQKYRHYLRQFAYYAQAHGVMRLDRVTAELLEGCQKQLAIDAMNSVVPASEKHGRTLRHNGPKTIRDKMKVVRQLIRFAMRRKLLREDPTPGYQLPPDPQIEAFCWSREELLAILKHADGRFTNAFQFFPLTGLRSSELCWLLKEDVCLTGKPYIQIRDKKCPITGKKWWPKKRKNRIVPLCPEAAEIAKRALNTSPGPWLFWNKPTKASPTGRFTPRQLLTGLKVAKKRAKVERGVVHTFRHVFCSFMANKKVPPLKVMKILGHGNLDIVLIYYHLSDDELLSSLEEVNFTELVGSNEQEAA